MPPNHFLQLMRAYTDVLILKSGLEHILRSAPPPDVLSCTALLVMRREEANSTSTWETVLNTEEHGEAECDFETDG